MLSTGTFSDPHYCKIALPSLTVCNNVTFFKFVLAAVAVPQALGESAQEYEQFYVPELQAKQRAKEKQERERQEKQLAKLRKDMASKATISGTAAGATATQQPQQHARDDEVEEALDDDEESATLELSDDSVEGSIGSPLD